MLKDQRKGITFGEFWTQFKLNLSTSWKILFSLCYVFIATFIVFPGVFFDSNWSIVPKSSWYTIISILTFNILDTTGRKLGGMYMISPGKVIAGSLLRTIFVIIEILIVVDKDNSGLFFEADWFKIVNLALFSISNGYIST